MHLKVLIYSRVSNADEINSSISQEQICKEQICKDYLHSISERNNFTYEIYDVFIEEPGLSGGEYYNRPLYIRMIELMNHNLIDAICVKESSRLDRNTEHSEKLRRLAKKKGIMLLSRDLDYDIHSPSGQFFYTINSAKNEYEKNVTGERTRLAIRNDMRKGKIHSHPIPLGFKKHPTENGRWIPIAEEISLVLLIFDIFNRTISYSLTANEINSLGYKAKKGLAFSPQLIKRTLQSRKYLGEQKIPEEDLIVPLSFGELVERKVFEQAQLNIQKIRDNKNSNRKANRISLLTGLLYSQSGNKFITTCSGKDSEKHSYYRLKSEDLTIPSQKIEQIVLDSIKQIKLQGDVKRYTGKFRSNENIRIKELKVKVQTAEKSVAKLEREKNEVFNLLLDPESRSTALIRAAEEKISNIDNQIGLFTKSIYQLNQDFESGVADLVATSDAIRSFDEEIDEALSGTNKVLQRKILRSLIKKIVIDMKSMTIKIFWLIKSTTEELIIFDNVSIPPITRFDEIQYRLLGKQPDQIETTPIFIYYVKEKYSSTRLAEKLGVTRSTILKYLKKHGIERNKTGTNIKRKRGISYGHANKTELSRIDKAKELRAEGMSYHKIAKLFNELNIPTKHKKKWHARSILEIIKN